MHRVLTRAFWVIGASTVAWVVGLSGRAVTAEPPGSPQRLLFETDVVPILRMYCWKCHGGEGRAGGLDMRSLPLLLAGGKSGPAIVRGAAAESRLIEKLATGRMPPGDELKPTAAHVATIRAWLDSGAAAAYQGG